MNNNEKFNQLSLEKTKEYYVTELEKYNKESEEIKKNIDATCRSFCYAVVGVIVAGIGANWMNYASLMTDVSHDIADITQIIALLVTIISFIVAGGFTLDGVEKLIDAIAKKSMNLTQIERVNEEIKLCELQMQYGSIDNQETKGRSR